MITLAERFRSWARSAQSQSHGTTLIRGRQIYILPSRYGLLFGALLFLMLIGSLNYDNNPAYLLTFFLISIALNAMYQTWRNLRGTQIRLLPCDAVFCGDSARLRFQLSAGDAIEHPAVQIQIDDSADIEDLPANGQAKVLELALPTARRGWFYPGRVSLSTRYPLGLFRAWCYLDLEERLLVYPAPAKTAATSAERIDNTQAEGTETKGQEDFFGLRDYRPGDSPKHIDWKSLARERGLMSKDFTEPKGHSRNLDWYALSGNTEQRIAILTRAVLDAEAIGQPYGLRLPGTSFDSEGGSVHRHRCLKALALFEPSDENKKETGNETDGATQ